MNNNPLYSSRIINTYIAYLKKHYPEVNAKELLDYAGITFSELEEQAHWLTQLQVDRFQNILIEKTKNKNIAREAGRFSISSGSFRTLRQYIIGFLTIKQVGAVMEKFTTHITRGSTFKARPIGPNSFEITVTPMPNVQEKPYQCENRLGILEGLSAAITKDMPDIQHPVCIHRGGDCCKYILILQRKKPFLLRRIRNYAVLISPIVLFVLYFLMPLVPFFLIALLLATVLLLVSDYCMHLEKKELTILMEQQGNAAGQLLNQIEMRYNESLLVQEIGQATSMILDPEKLLKFIMEALEKRLDFDRGMIMLANKDKTRLVYAFGYGYKTEYEEYLKSAEFHLDNPQSRGIFVETYRKQLPSIINDLSEVEGTLSPRSQEFAKRLGAESFICVPIIYEGESMGILLVDNIQSKRRLTQSDVNLLMGIAPQIGISLNNAMSYQKIQESEERFRSLSENAPDIIYTLNVHGIFTHINPACERILGHQKENVIGKPFTDFIRKEDAPYYVRILKQIRDQKETVRDILGIILHKDGSEKFFNISGAPNLNSEGHVTGIVGTFKDITELRNSEESYRLFINGTDDMAYLKDDQFRYIFINKATAKFFNREDDEIIGKTDFDLLPENMAMIYKKSDASALSVEGVFVTEEIINQRVYELRKFRIKLVNGQAGVGAYIRDITQQRDLESRLMQAQKIEAIGTLAGGIAHDFNNLLMGIQGYTSLLLIDLKDRHPDYERVKSIQDQVKSGADLTKQLLGFARQGRYQVKPTQINNLIRKSASMFGRTKKEIKIHEHYQNDVWTVAIDQGQIEQVLLNLYVNSWQAMPSGGDIYLRTENVIPVDGFLQAHNIRSGRYVKITVTDTGVGMDEETRIRIFEPFFTTKEMGRGTGLGLASVYGIIKGHNGFIDVSSKPGHGTCFRLYLPASDHEVMDEAPTEQVILQGKETILLADDEETVLEVTKEILESLGYKVLSAHGGQEAINVYKTDGSKIDLIILDMIMPGMGGGEAFEILKGMNPDVRIILSSGYSADGQAKEILEKGVKAFLQKPFQIHELSQTVRDALDK
jgi:PAS domain S-box-containing protein